jgi:hypothetical protein
MDSMTATPTPVSVRPAEPADAAQFTDLLGRNRDYFRSGEPERRDAYYTLDAQRRLIEQAVEARRAGNALMFVIEEDGQLAGRINLNSLIRGAFQSASVGYLVDQHMAAASPPPCFAGRCRRARATCGSRLRVCPCLPGTAQLLTCDACNSITTCSS